MIGPHPTDEEERVTEAALVVLFGWWICLAINPFGALPVIAVLYRIYRRSDDR